MSLGNKLGKKTTFFISYAESTCEAKLCLFFNTHFFMVALYFLCCLKMFKKFFAKLLSVRLTLNKGMFGKEI